MKKEIKSQLDVKKPEKKSVDFKWILQLGILAFSISIGLSFVTEVALSNANLLISVLAVIGCILIAIIFDIVAIAITTADEAPFHSMAARKVPGSKVAVKLKKNAGRLNSIFGDVVGDICGIVSGTASVYIAIILADMWDISLLVCTLVTTALVASATITAKALEKNFAMDNSTYILYYTAKVIGVFYKPK